MRVKVILNPCSDNGRGGLQRELIESFLLSRCDTELTVTQAKGHAVSLARDASYENFDVILAAGGDGTVHEVINGIMQGMVRECRFGVIPVGSGNDFAYTHGIPLKVEEAALRIFDGRSLAIDLGKVVDDRGRKAFFDNNFGAGFDANVVIRTAEITRLHGFPKYILGVLKSLFLDFEPYQYQMRFDEEELVGPVMFVSFGLGKRHGGGFLLTPDARFDDNLVDTCTVSPLSRVQALPLLYAAVKGTHVNSPLVTMRQNKTIQINAEQPLSVHIDGEIFAHPRDQVFGLTVTSLPAALELIA